MYKGQTQCHSQLGIVIILLQRLVNLEKGFNKSFFNLQLRGVSRKVKKNNIPEMIKKELLASIVLLDGEENYLELNEEVKIREGAERWYRVCKKI